MADDKPIPLSGSIAININQKMYQVHISPPGPMVALEDLTTSLEHNRKRLAELEEALLNEYKREYYEYAPPWMLNYDALIQNALVARLNINILVPMINMKGGKAEFSKFESWTVKQHIEFLISKSQRLAAMSRIPHGVTSVPSAIALSLLVVAFVMVFYTFVA